ncbi:unnamed protein product [Cuscuta europaea]|uniref:Protein kinase domain-containing protein n=1 Tax=Cuscuta europaea TaxID=41803 RepID=A0A9P0YVQ5_CUSEU|nr:unnamed protein product [Cuscuta europaea]
MHDILYDLNNLKAKELEYSSQEMKTTMQMQLTAAAAAALLLATGFALAASAAQTESRGSGLGCPSKCGNVTIYYPFGVGEKCALNRDFTLSCEDSKLWTTYSQNSQTQKRESQITAIDYGKGQMDILKQVSSDCYTESGKRIPAKHDWLNVTNAFTVSSKANTFYTVGCNTYGVFRSSKEGSRFATGCVQICDRAPEKKDVGNCSGFGCCRTNIPAIGLRDIEAEARSLTFDKKVWKFNNCSYSFVAKKGWYGFIPEDLMRLRFDSAPLVVNWAVGNRNQTCKSADTDGGGYVCGPNTECVETEFRCGYRCKCKDGYDGIPYSPHECYNIDECKYNKQSPEYPCGEEATCYDTNGSHACKCGKGYEGDGNKSGEGCRKSISNNTVLLVGLSISTGVTTLLVVSLFIYWGLRKRRLSKLREKFFHQNGGILLQQQIAGNGGSNDARMKIFTLKDLEKATNNFDEKKILGQGGYGTVYKGVLYDIGAVAIKRSNICEKRHVEQFINEVIILSQINHRNVVKLFGCCLETEVPLLVYEFITNNTLYEHLHKQAQSSNLSWTTRLRVASESAGALSYLHSAASPPIIHRDIKTANILLDDRLTAKVADFGASRLVPLDQTQVTTLVQGTFGYLDPEYFHTSQLTHKSDVYSFGIVLAELLTGEKAISYDRADDDMNLGAYFVSSLENGRMSQIMDPHIVNDVDFEQYMEVAKIVSRCLKVKREERPTMREVAMEIEGLRGPERQPLEGLGDNEMSSRTINVRDSFISRFYTIDGESMEPFSRSLSGGR